MRTVRHPLIVISKIALFISVMALAGACQNPNAARTDQGLGRGAPENTVDVRYVPPGTPTPEPLADYGLVRVDATQLRRFADNPLRYDRTLIAGIAAQSISQMNGIRYASIIATDETVFVGLEPSGDVDAAKLIARVKQAVESAVPGFYRVYATTDRSLIQRAVALTETAPDDLDRRLSDLLSIAP
ncbi:MAG: YhcN/YlaJ family sporulation lipoprotein [Hydrogenibacillus sp.]|nr:YhcN/YlaJ family sporulation lipoprotein [Hydrogenibacillus sp.]